MPEMKLMRYFLGKMRLIFLNTKMMMVCSDSDLPIHRARELDLKQA